MLPQPSTEGILRAALAKLGVTPELGTELVGLEQDDKAVTVRLLKHSTDGRGETQEESITVDWMIGTDGGKGRVLRVLQLGEADFLSFRCYAQTPQHSVPWRNA